MNQLWIGNLADVPTNIQPLGQVVAIPSAAPAPAPPDPDAVPVFDPTVHSRFAMPDMTKIATFDQLMAAGFGTAGGAQPWPAGVDPHALQDVSSDPLGSNLVIPDPMYGNAARVRFYGKTADGVLNKQEVHCLGLGSRADHPNPFGTAAGTPGHTFYLRYKLRVTGGGGYRVDQDLTHRAMCKFIELWSPGGSRAQFPTGYANFVSPDLPLNGSGSIAMFGPNSGANSLWNCMQARGPWLRELQGSWINVDIEYVTQTGTTDGSGNPVPNGTTRIGNGDGRARMWWNDVLIVACGRGYVGVPVPGGVVNTKTGKPETWCEAPDVAAMHIDTYVNYLNWVSVESQGQQKWQHDYDLTGFDAWMVK